MSRSKVIKKRKLTPDFKYNNEYVTQLINYVMKQGKKETARRIVYKSFENVEKKLGKSPLEVFLEAINNVRPLMQVRSKRVGGATYSIPMEVSSEKSIAFSMKWFCDAIRERALKNAELDLTQVLVDSYNKTGFAIGKRNEMHRQAEANKVFAYFNR